MELISKDVAIKKLEQRREIVLQMAGIETSEFHAIEGCIDDIKNIPVEKES